MKMYHITSCWNVDSILKLGLLISKSKWGKYIYLTTDVKKCLKLYPSLPKSMLSVFKVNNIDKHRVLKDPLHPRSSNTIGYAYSINIPPKNLCLICQDGENL